MSQSIDRALSVLDALRERPHSVAEIAHRLDVHPTTAFRVLQALGRGSLVQRSGEGRYALGPGLIDLGQTALESIDLRSVARPSLERLSRVTGEAVHLAVLVEGAAVYIDKFDSIHPVRMYSRVGLKAHLHCTGVGKAILSALPPEARADLLADHEFVVYTDSTIRDAGALEADLIESAERGFCIDAEEHEYGIHCIARPIRHRDGTVAGSLSVSAPTSRISRDELLAFAPAVADAATAIESELGIDPRSGEFDVPPISR